MTRTFTRWVVTAGLLALSAPLGAQTIDTRGTSDDNLTLNGTVRLIGQSFTAPNSVLNEVDFYLLVDQPTQVLLYAFNGTGPFGSPVYVSPVFTATRPFEQLLTVPQQFVLNQAVTPGAQYIAFVAGLGIHPLSSFIVRTARNGQVSADTYAGGAAYWYSQSGGAVPDLTAITYNTDIRGVAGADLGVVLTFSNTVTAAPEPSAVALLMTGLVGLGGIVRRRRAIGSISHHVTE